MSALRPHGRLSGALSPPREWSLRRLAYGIFALVLVVLAAVFAALALAIVGLHREADRQSQHIQVLETANGAERSVVDLETGLRGFLLTDQSRFLGPYWQALGALPGELSTLRAEVSGDPAQVVRVEQLSNAISSYESGYAYPIATSGGRLASGRVLTVTSEGKRLLDAIRARFAALGAAEAGYAYQGSSGTASSAREALVIAGAGFAVTAMVLLALVYYLQRSILRPVGQVANAADRRQGGEVGVQVSEDWRGEIALLARAFNAMTSTLEERDRALTVARDRLQGVLDHAGAVIYVKDSEGRYLLVNRAFEQARDLKAQEALGRTEQDFSPPEAAAQIAADDRAVARSGEPVWAGYTVPTIHGVRTYLSVKFPIPSPDGEEATIGGISTDITEQKEALSAAMEASRLKSQFVANMSHEIRTPLSGVIGMTNLLRDTELRPVQREYVEALAASGEALLGVIGDILDFSKIEAGRLELDPTDFDLRTLVEESCLMMAARSYAKGLELSHWVEDEVPAFVRGDRNRLRQVLLNLLSNAVKFTDSGEVVVRVTGSGEEPLRFEVSDTGVGIAASGTESLFEPFSQADQSTTRQYGGTGLGLAICRELVTLMGGEIGAAGRTEGGSVFWFTAELAAVAVPAGAERSRADLTGLRALVVDDNRTNLLVMRQYLSAWGLTCDTLEDSTLALEALERARRDGHPYQLALLDYHMPGLDGIELAGAIRARPALATTAIVLLTSSVADTETAERAGVRHHLLKPPRQSDLYDAIAQAIGGQGPAALPAPPEKAPGASREPPVVLIAEDNEVIRLLATTMLEQRGLRTETARTGLEAVHLSTINKYVAIFMDCQMPELDGYRATERIRAAQTDRRTPIIAMTAHSMPGDRERCLAAGMDDYIAKPIQPGQLERVLERWVPANGARNARAASGSHDPLDPQVVERIRCDLDPPMRKRLLSTFEQSLQASLADAAQALEQRDEQELGRIAHRLRGSSATIGARRLSDACHALGRAIGADDTTVAGELEHLEALSESTVSELRARLLDTQ